MQQSKSSPKLSQNQASRAEAASQRGHHVLQAIGLTIGGADQAHDEGRKEGREQERKRTPRRKSQSKLVQTAERAGLQVTALNPDGSVEIGGKGEAETIINSNPWDEVLSHENR